jgi:hypothetical protein
MGAYVKDYKHASCRQGKGQTKPRETPAYGLPLHNGTTGRTNTTGDYLALAGMLSRYFQNQPLPDSRYYILKCLGPQVRESVPQTYAGASPRQYGPLGVNHSINGAALGKS